jgi:hypothetical protein
MSENDIEDRPPDPEDVSPVVPSQGMDEATEARLEQLSIQIEELRRLVDELRGTLGGYASSDHFHETPTQETAPEGTHWYFRRVGD